MRNWLRQNFLLHSIFIGKVVLEIDIMVAKVPLPDWVDGIVCTYKAQHIQEVTKIII